MSNLYSILTFISQYIYSHSFTTTAHISHILHHILVVCHGNLRFHAQIIDFCYNVEDNLWNCDKIYK